MQKTSEEDMLFISLSIIPALMKEVLFSFAYCLFLYMLFICLHVVCLFTSCLFVYMFTYHPCPDEGGALLVRVFLVGR